MKSQQHPVPGPQASARHTEEGERFNRTLFAALEALENENISYALFGGVAASGMGRPRSTHDIDIFVRPEDAESTLASLSHHGFETERTDERWLFKGFKDQHMVDIIFKSSGDIYFDDEMEEHSALVHFHGHHVRVVSPEDLIIIKCAVHSEAGPHHWHDALALLSHAPVDWQYLLRRSRKASRRLLALLIYAQSNDILIPNSIITELYNRIFTDAQAKGDDVKVKYEGSKRYGPSERVAAPGQNADEYVAGQIKDRLAKDGRIGMLDLRVRVEGEHILIKGECLAESQRQAVEDMIHEIAPSYVLDNQLRVSVLPGPEGIEVIQ